MTHTALKPLTSPAEIAPGVGVSSITIYGPNQCPICTMAGSYFSRHGISITRTVITAGDEHHQLINTELGYTQAPVLFVEFSDGTTGHFAFSTSDLAVPSAVVQAALGLN